MAAQDETVARSEPDVTVQFAHDVSAPARVRHALAGLLDDQQDPIAFAVELVASELVSNVIQHTADGGSIRAWEIGADRPFRIEVLDRYTSEPKVAEMVSDTDGRGLQLVDDLADAWGVIIHEHGKTVWAEFRRPLAVAVDDPLDPPPRVAPLDVTTSVISRLDPPITVVTTASDGRNAGCLVAFHTQCNLDPVRYAVWIAKSNHTYRIALLADHVAMHVLHQDDQTLAETFGGRSGADADKFASLEWHAGPSGVPLLADCTTRLVLRKVSMWDDGSDHVCFIGEPVNTDAAGVSDQPLLRVSDAARSSALYSWAGRDAL